MRRLIFVFLLIPLCLSFGVCAVTAADKETPPWMEDVIAGDRKIYLIPKGAKKKVFGSQVTVEPTEEYVARRIYEFEQLMEERFKTMDEKYAVLFAEIEALKNSVDQLKQVIVETAAEDGSGNILTDGSNAASQ